MTKTSGTNGRLYWVYQQVAVVKGWCIEGDVYDLSLTAHLASFDTFRLSQRPLVFVATLPTRVWRFPVLELQVTGASLVAKLGPQELSSEPQSQTSRK